MPAKPKAASTPKPPINWAEVHARMEGAGASITPLHATDKVAEILARRAQALAQAPVDTSAATGELEVVAFELGTQVFGLEAEHVREAVLPRDVTRLPGLPVHVRGVVNLRSRVVPALDLRPLLQLPPATAPAEEKLLLATFEGTDFGVFTDRVVGLRQVSLTALRREVAGLNDKYLRGLTEDGLVLLDLAALFPDLVVGDDDEL